MRRTRRITAFIAALALIAGSVISCDNWGIASIIGGKKTDEKAETGTDSGNGGGVTPSGPEKVPVERVVISPGGDLGGAVGGFMPL
ncbi:MAG: hypothetical protein LBV68_07890, partial [Spirochaetaceae bacterium]|nr:hypothetical protein [Spirochaetaceae bacterium]